MMGISSSSNNKQYCIIWLLTNLWSRCNVQTKWEEKPQLTFLGFMPYNPFQIHTGPRFTWPKAFRFRYYSNIASIHTHWTSPYQKLLNWSSNVGGRWGKVGRQNLRCKTTGDRRRRCRHCKEGVNLKTKTKKDTVCHMLKVLGKIVFIHTLSFEYSNSTHYEAVPKKSHDIKMRQSKHISISSSNNYGHLGIFVFKLCQCDHWVTHRIITF